MVNKNRSVSSNRWLKEHYKDQYVQQAQAKGLRSRAWFKLAEIQQRDKLFTSGMNIVDLGAAPGSWSQYVVTQISGIGRVIACDILPIDPIIGVDFLQGDIREELIFKSLFALIDKSKIKVVMSDMAPNISGIPSIDIPKAMYLVELALEICRDILTPGGSFVVKVFQGEGFEECLRKISSLFTKIKIRKPNASRLYSREVYIVATGHKL